MAVFVFFSLSGCKKPDEIGAAANNARIVKDDLGHDVKLPDKVESAVSLAPSITELIFAAGAGDRLVGVTTYCDYPAEARSIAKVGDTQTPNIERIVALKPQVVFVSTASQLEAFAKTLDEQGIAVFVTNPTGLETVLRNLETLGELFGTKEVADRTVADLRRRIAEIENRVSGGTRVRVFVQFSRDPLYTIGRDAFVTDIVERAGGISVTKDLPTAFPVLSKETALALRPDVIILSDSEDNKEPNVVFNSSPAVRNGHVYKVNADILSRPGPRLVDALEEMSTDLVRASLPKD